MEVGLRVVRGPDWKWGNQDDGEGHVGTVVEIGKVGSSTSPDKTVVVQWDSGSRTNYRIGYQEAFDLFIYDNAPIGIKHPNIICDACRKQGIPGMRWKCSKCHDFDLCSLCYMADEHDTTHTFTRFDTASSKGVKVGRRANCDTIQVKGIFKGAKVVRGPDWDWGNQDGGEAKVGKVIDIRGWDSESGRSVANVTWSSGTTNVYRLGHKGKVDIKYIQEGLGGTYYRDQLPVVGRSSKNEFSESAPPNTAPSQFKVGDKVRCDLDSDILKVMQDGHGGWNAKMAEYVGKVGTVHRITERGDVRVQHEGCSNRWTFHPGSLTKVHVFSVGDIVRISDNLHFVKERQSSHGEWIEAMRGVLGKVGEVSQVFSDQDLRITVGTKAWTLNPACCTLVPHGAQEFNNTLGGHEREEPQDTMRQVLDQIMELHTYETGPERLVREAAQGHLDIVADIIKKFPDKVDQKSSGKTALQVSCHQGHGDIVQLLIHAKVDLTLQDEDGDSALHYAAFGNQSEIMELLIERGARVDSLNNGGCSTLHVAVNKQHTRCVVVVLKYGCDVNIQDAYGDTALHDAIGKESREIMEMLIAYPTIDFMCKNKRGFNVLHHAALKGNHSATESILLKCRQITDIKKDDGFAALHLAALNGHKDVVNALLTAGQGDIEIRNNRQQTPLLLAVSQGHAPLIELLVTKGSDVRVEDEDGDTCLHLALMRQSVATDTHTSPMLDAIRTQLNLTHGGVQQGVDIACYLAQQGASLNHKNHNGKTPLDLITDPVIEEVVRQFATTTSNIHTVVTGAENQMPELPVECVVCYENVANVTFQPCNHTMVCSSCCLKMKRCLQCRKEITAKIGPGGNLIGPNMPTSQNIRASDQLQQRLQEMEETILCTICMERKRNMAFMCGHTVCSTCGESLKTCHMCRKAVSKRITLF